MRNFLLLLSLIFIANCVQAYDHKDQMIVGDRVAPSASAALQVESTTQGFLPPRMDTVERDAIPLPAMGLIIFNTDIPGLEIYTGAWWASTGATSLNALSDVTLTAPATGNVLQFTGLIWENLVQDASTVTMNNDPTYTVKNFFDQSINKSISSDFVFTDDGGLNFSWSAGAVYDLATKLPVLVNAGSASCVNNDMTYVYWAAGNVFTVSNVSAAGIRAAVIGCQDGDIVSMTIAPPLNEGTSNLVGGLHSLMPIAVSTGLEITEDADVTNVWDVSLSSGVYNIGVRAIIGVAAIDSRTLPMVRHFKTAGVWNSDTNAEIDSTQYNDGTDLVAVSGTSYYKSCFYITNDTIHWVYPTEAHTQSEATAADCPTLPPGLHSAAPVKSLVLLGAAISLPQSESTLWSDIRPNPLKEYKPKPVYDIKAGYVNYANDAAFEAAHGTSTAQYNAFGTMAQTVPPLVPDYPNGTYIYPLNAEENIGENWEINVNFKAEAIPFPNQQPIFGSLNNGSVREFTVALLNTSVYISCPTSNTYAVIAGFPADWIDGDFNTLRVTRAGEVYNLWVNGNAWTSNPFTVVNCVTDGEHSVENIGMDQSGATFPFDGYVQSYSIESADYPAADISGGYTVNATVDEGSIYYNTTLNVIRQYRDGQWFTRETITPWITIGEYSIGMYVNNLDKLYVCKTNHTAGVFATDLASGYWAIVGASALDDLTDVTLTSPIQGNALLYDGSGWINQTPFVRAFFNGGYQFSPSITVSESAGTVYLAIEKEGGGDLNIVFNSAQVLYDTTPPQQIALTAGSDTAPTLNYIYIDSIGPTLTVNTSGWPTGIEYAPVATVLVQSAASVAADGAYKVHAWTDHMSNGDNIGHLQHVNKWIRSQHATYETGVDLTFAGSGTAAITFESTAGTVLQLHEHAFDAFASPAEVRVVNDSVTPYVAYTDLADILLDSTGGALQGNVFSLVIWGSVNENTGNSKFYVNLPSGSYGNEADARGDGDKYTNYSIPEDFTGTGFLVHRMIMGINNPGTVWTIYPGEGDDIRGHFPNTVGGSSSSTTTTFSDNLFSIYNVADATKLLSLDLAGITTGNTRTLTIPDADGTLLLATGLAGGQTLIGGSAASENLTLSSTSDVTKGNIFLNDYASLESGGNLNNADGLNYRQFVKYGSARDDKTITDVISEANGATWGSGGAVTTNVAYSPGGIKDTDVDAYMVGGALVADDHYFHTVNIDQNQSLGFRVHYQLYGSATDDDIDFRIQCVGSLDWLKNIPIENTSTTKTLSGYINIPETGCSSVRMGFHVKNTTTGYLKWNRLTLTDNPFAEITTVESPDTVTKYLGSGTVTSPQTMSDLTFSDLEIGKEYEVTGLFYMFVQVGGTGSTVQVYAKNGATTLNRSRIRNDNSNVDNYITIPVAFKFVATDATLEFNADIASTTAYISGSSNRLGTYVQLSKVTAPSQNVVVAATKPVENQVAITATGVNVSGATGTAVYSTTANGKHYLDFDIEVSLSSSLSNTDPIEITGVIPHSRSQTVAVIAVGTAPYTGSGQMTSAGLSGYSTTATSTYRFQGNIEIASPPTWATYMDETVLYALPTSEQQTFWQAFQATTGVTDTNFDNNTTKMGATWSSDHWALDYAALGLSSKPDIEAVGTSSNAGTITVQSGTSTTANIYIHNQNGTKVDHAFKVTLTKSGSDASNGQVYIGDMSPTKTAYLDMNVDGRMHGAVTVGTTYTTLPFVQIGSDSEFTNLSLSANQVTLPKGRYTVRFGGSPTAGSGWMDARVYDITNGAPLREILYASYSHPSETLLRIISAPVETSFTLTDTTVIEFQLKQGVSGVAYYQRVAIEKRD